MKFDRLLCCLAVFMAPMLQVSAQQLSPSNGDWQLWPEISLSVALNERVSLLGFATMHFGQGVSDLNEEQVGAGLNVTLNKYFSFSPAYRFLRRQPSGRPHVREHRGFLEFGVRLPLGHQFHVSERNRGELRRIDGVVSGRYRNRLQIERPFKIDARKITPYVADEVFYDSRYHIWNRNRIYAGVRVPLTSHFGIDGYFLEQHDVRDRPFTRRHVIALSLRLDY